MSLIGISGFAGSGKDTVGTIIQYLSCPNPGTSLEDILNEPKYHNEWWLDETSGWETKSWAHKLKQICSIITGIPLQNFDDQEFKKTYLGPEWGVFHKTIKNERGYPIDVENRLITVREMLQMVGTDCLRNTFNYNIWINALMADYVPTEEGTLPKWVVTDTRFLNEVEAIKKRDGKIVRVERKDVTPPNAHSSEMELASYKDFDYIIYNNGTIEDLTRNVSMMLTTFGFDQKPTIYNSPNK
jgi:hypothetical protein